LNDAVERGTVDEHSDGAVDGGVEEDRTTVC